MLGLSISNVWQWHAECFSRLLLMYAYGRAPVAGPGPHTDTAATAGWRVESVGGGEVGVGLVSGSSWCGEEECPALAQTLSNTSMLDGARRGAAASTR